MEPINTERHSFTVTIFEQMEEGGGEEIMMMRIMMRRRYNTVRLQSVSLSVWSSSSLEDQTPHLSFINIK